MDLSFDFSKVFNNVSQNISTHWDKFREQSTNQLQIMSDTLGMPSTEVAETMNLLQGSLEDIKNLYNGYSDDPTKFATDHDLVNEHDILYKDNPQIAVIDREVTEEQKHAEMNDALRHLNSAWGSEYGLGAVVYYPDDDPDEFRRGQINYGAMDKDIAFNMYCEEHGINPDDWQNDKTDDPMRDKTKNFDANGALLIRDAKGNVIRTISPPRAPIVNGRANYLDPQFLEQQREWQSYSKNREANLDEFTSSLLSGAYKTDGSPDFEEPYPYTGTDEEKAAWYKKKAEADAAWAQAFSTMQNNLKNKANTSILGSLNGASAMDAYSDFLYETDPKYRIKELNKKIPQQQEVVNNCRKDAERAIAEAKKKAAEEARKKKEEERKAKEQAEKDKANQNKDKPSKPGTKQGEEKNGYVWDGKEWKKKDSTTKKAVSLLRTDPKPSGGSSSSSRRNRRDRKKDQRKGGNANSSRVRSEYSSLPEVKRLEEEEAKLKAYEAELNGLQGKGVKITSAQAKELGIDMTGLKADKSGNITISAEDFKKRWQNAKYKNFNATSAEDYRDKTAMRYADELAAYANWLGDPKNAIRARSENIVAVDVISGANDPKNKVNTKFADLLQLTTPGWGYDEFINERNIFQKSLYTGVTEQGWWYFKIFFNFDTQYGLLGGILNNNGNPMGATNSAYMYLQNIVSRGQFERVMARKEALVKFVKILSYINTNAPWFFKDVKNLNQANIPLLNDFSKEKSIEIGCREDSIDMRLTTLLDLYKFVTYDEINQKEILPDNLRKFDMSVVLFQVPLRYFHTAFITSDGESYPYKNLNGDPSTGFSNMMSFKMFTFINCEIDINSLGSMIPGTVSNEKPFTMGGGSIKIKYDRVYTHTFNEFNKLMFGSDGFQYNADSNAQISMMSGKLQDKRIKAINENMINSDSKTHSGLYKGMVDAAEYLCSHRYMDLGLDALGNIAGAENKALLGKKVNGKIVFEPNDYVKLKLKLLKSTNKTELLNVLGQVNSGGDKFIQNLIDSYRNYLSIDNQWVAGAYETDINSEIGARYWEEKIRTLKGKNIFKKLTNKIYSKLFNTSVGSVRSGYNGTNGSVNNGRNEVVTSRIQDTIVNSMYYMDKIHELKTGTQQSSAGRRSRNNVSSVSSLSRNTAQQNINAGARDVMQFTPAPVNAFGNYDKLADDITETNNTTMRAPVLTTSNENNMQNPDSDYYLNKLRQLKQSNNKGNKPKSNNPINNPNHNSGLGNGGRSVSSKNSTDNETFFNRGRMGDLSSAPGRQQNMSAETFI